MTEELIARLREAAEAATLGPWRFVRWCADEDEALLQMHCGSGPDDWRWSGWVGLRNEQDARFIALWNPATALSLLDRIAELEKGLADAVADELGDNWKARALALLSPKGPDNG